MKDYRNIRRSLMINKAARKIRKQHNIMTPHYIHIMYIIWLLNGTDKYISVSTIYRTFLKVNKSAMVRRLNQDLEIIVNNGYLIRHEIYSQYRITLQGINILNISDETIRKERWNR